MRKLGTKVGQKQFFAVTFRRINKFPHFCTFLLMFLVMISIHCNQTDCIIRSYCTKTLFVFFSVDRKLSALTWHEKS